MKKAIELVGYGHADRFADYLSEKILDAHLSKDKFAKVAAEVMVTRDIIFLGGEITSKAIIDYQELIYDSIQEIYGEKWWPNYKQTKIINNIKKQSVELNNLQTKEEIVAGDQGIIYGYYNHQQYEIIKSLYQLFDALIKKFHIAPDWKLLYILDQELSMSLCGIESDKYVEVEKFINNYGHGINFKKLIINPGGEWLICGPKSDTGLTGRKLMMESFNTGLPHGGGAFCGKDISKIDKTAALWATFLAYEEYQKDQKDQKDYLVRLIFKIGDKNPIISSNFHSKELRDMKLEQSLNQFIQYKNLLNKNNWSKSVKKGGMVDLIESM